MTTLEPEQKDILEKLNEIALEANWGTAERVNGVPKAVAVIQEAMKEIQRLREQNAKLLDLSRAQNMDLIYLMLEVKGHREQLSSEGLQALCALRFHGGERGEKYSPEEVDKRIKKNIEMLQEIRGEK